jgi:hypothetical protein
MLGDRLCDPITIRGHGEQLVANRGNIGTPGEAAEQFGLLTKRGDAFHCLSPERDLAREDEGDFSTLPCGDPMLTQTRPKEIPHHVRGPWSDHPHLASAVYERVQNSETLCDLAIFSIP